MGREAAPEKNVPSAPGRRLGAICLVCSLILILVAVFVAGPLNLWYSVRDVVSPPRVVLFELEDTTRTDLHPGEKVRVRFHVENTDEVVITGGAEPLRFREREYGGEGIPEAVEVPVSGSPGEYSLALEARRLRRGGHGSVVAGGHAAAARPLTVKVTEGTGRVVAGTSGTPPAVPGTPFVSAEAAEEWARAYNIPFRREEVPDPSQAGGTVISQEPGPGEPVDRKNGLTVIVTKDVGERHPEASPVQQLTNGPADDTYARWVVEAVGTGGESGLEPRTRIILVGPSRLAPGRAVQGPVLAIGSGGAEFLQQLDAAHFRPGTARRLTQTRYSRDGLALLGVQVPPGAGDHLEVASREVLTTALLGGGERGWEATPLLLQSGSQTPQVVAGWRGKVAFWGFAEPESLGDEMKVLFQSLVKRLIGSPDSAGHRSLQR